jgi:hypothetical protein
MHDIVYDENQHMVLTTAFNAIIANPLYYIGVVVVSLAVLSFLVYLRGFISGVGHIFDDGAHIEHQHHADQRTIWGALLLIVIFILWETLRTTFGLFSGTATATPVIGITLAIIWAIVIWWLFFAEPSKGGGGGH